MIDVWILDLMGLFASFTFLGFASWQDIKSREVTDRVWLVSYPIGLGLLALRFLTQDAPWVLIVISIASATALSIALPYFRLWGGADSKAFICIAIMNPLAPAFRWPMLHSVNPFFPLVVFANAYIASLASVLYVIQRNLRSRRFHELFEGLEGESRSRKVAAFLSGYRVPVEELESKPFLFPIETIRRQASEVKRGFKLEVTVDSNPQNELAQMKAAMDSGLLRGTVWVSPGLPFLLFVTAGLGLSLLLGDIVWYFVSALVVAVRA